MVIEANARGRPRECQAMLLPSELSPPTSRDWITAGGGPWRTTVPSPPGARGLRDTDRHADSAPPDFRVSAALGHAAVSGGSAHHAEDRLSHLCAQRAVRPPAPDDAAAAGTEPDQPGGPQQRALGDGSDPCVLWPRRLGPSRRGDRLPRSPSAGGRRRPSGRSRRLVWNALAPCVPAGPRRLSAPTTGWSIRAGASGRRAGTTASPRSSSRNTRPSRMELSSASFTA